jgi:hypothetical protein
VLATLQRPANDIVELGTANGTLSTTPEHPFALAGTGWIKSADLQIGDRIVSAHQGQATIQIIGHKHQSTTVYNLTVEAAHAYFVGPDALLVHNVCGGYSNYDTAYKAARHFLRYEHPGGQEVMAYTDGAFENFNHVRRGQTDGMTRVQIWTWLHKAAKAEQALRDAARKGLNYKGDVYRGVDLDGVPPQVAAQLRGLRPGDGYSDPGFLSSSADKSVVWRIDKPNGVILQIHCKHAGIALEGVTRYEDESEMEVLFPPGVRFVCTGRHDSDGKQVIELEEVSGA